MDYRSARRLASARLAAAARRMGVDVRGEGFGPDDRARLERVFGELGDEMERRAGVAHREDTGPGPGQFALFDPPEKEDDHEEV